MAEVLLSDAATQQLTITDTKMQEGYLQGCYMKPTQFRCVKQWCTNLTCQSQHQTHAQL